MGKINLSSKPSIRKSHRRKRSESQNLDPDHEKRSQNLENDPDLERKVRGGRDRVIGKSVRDRENDRGRKNAPDRKNGRDRESENRKNRVEDRDLVHQDENARAQGRDRQVYRGSEKIYKKLNGKFREVV